MKVVRLMLMCAIALIATSCGTVSKNTSFSFNDVRLEMGMEDLEYLGEAEISVDYTTYIGMFCSIQKINGETYDPTNKKLLNIPGQNLFKSEKLNLAAYKLVELFPEAVYFQVVFETRDVNKLFLGSTKRDYAKVRAYNIKKRVRK